MIQRFILIFILLVSIQATLYSQPFKDVSLQSKVSLVSNNNGVAVADYDNDNDLDFFVVTRYNSVTNRTASSYLFRNNNDGTFTNVTARSGINSAHNYKDTPVPGLYSFGEKMGASWGDYDNDGYPDLFLTNAFYNELYHNNKDGTFTNVTASAGFPEEDKCYHTHALWFDFDNDSFLDLYLTSIFNCNGSFYRNNQDGTFTEMTDQVGLGGSGQASWMAVPWDINEDGYQDLYVTRDFGSPNECFINVNGESFVNKVADYGLQDEGKDGMGIALSDFNNDGLVDLFITNINESSLYKQTSTGVFENVAADLDVEKTDWAWGCQFRDFDHDLDLDLMVLNGFNNKAENRYYENQSETGQEAFSEKGVEYGFGELSFSNCLATFDYDLDGDLDILISKTDDNLQLIENQLIDGSPVDSKNWLQVGLEGTTSNRDGIGAVIRVSLGDTVLTRYYHGASLMAQSLQPVHFGLGDHTGIDELTITWPLGLKEKYTGDEIQVNTFVHLVENEGTEVLDISSEKIPGCTDPNSCNYDPEATYDDGSCTYLDAAGGIVGNTSAGIISTHTYSYPGRNGSTYNWSIKNGTIINGQGESSITVRWGIADKGEIEVTEINECYGLPVKLEVMLNTTEAPDNVSVARMWNEVLLEGIRNDYARPTVHARNLFHTSVALYDAWALFDDEADTYLIGKELHGYTNYFEGFETKIKKEKAIDAAMSYAAYRLLSNRFKYSPHHEETQEQLDALMNILGYNSEYTSTNYTMGNVAALGNFIGQSIIDYGLSDGSNEANKYANIYYHPVNEPLVPVLPGNPSIAFPNRWQPLELDVFIDQAGNVTAENTPAFLSPEWGDVDAFCLDWKDANVFSREGNDYTVYLDPGAPPHINQQKISGSDIDLYKWNFSLVSVWSSHLDPFDSVMWDISPASIGNINFSSLPKNIVNHDDFYDLLQGGDISTGREINPYSGQPYEPQIVPRGDYTRVLAEFWADGPDSETPPGHWFVLLNYISDHPNFERKFKGEEILDPLEWDVKAYFTLGGTMHDAAIAAWAVKGWYDFIRPISAIRYMADNGQSTDQSLPNYHQDGIPLIDGFIELVEEEDSLAGTENENVGKIKLFAWKGHNYVYNTETDQAGVDWILAENWWPYQRPSFVTPPFAGYVSGHSTYSRAAAEVITALTGSEYFPGGLGEFVAKKNEFLVFEEGPSQDVVLQWATYRDASDQCSLSRIWGGIHPPCDDIPGRILGAKIGLDAFAFAEKYFQSETVDVPYPIANVQTKVYPVPSSDGLVYITGLKANQLFTIHDALGNIVAVKKSNFSESENRTVLNLKDLANGFYIVRSGQQSWKIILKK
ncbi:FG-GAP-like repeat-containing protein [Maribellus mangrovi]|uniref:FG-GAP-like repeat-containing protein n=1 Tax=Maribellus mangrovi TaxID=3133146 RepID=UPI0030EC899F